MLVELLLELEDITRGVTPDGSEFDVLLFGPKNHSKVGEGTSEGRGMGSKRVAEHISE